MCARANGVDTGQWYDEVLLSTESTIVLPALGAIAAGHVLVLPRQHLSSAQCLDPSDRTDFVRSLNDVADRLAQRMGPVTIFEHGAALAGSGPRSACSEHAHVQVLPGNYGLRNALDYELTYESPAAFYSRDPPFYPYLFLCESGGDALVARDVGQSQFFRRVLLDHLGDPDRWDYWVFPREDKVRETIALFA